MTGICLTTVAASGPVRAVAYFLLTALLLAVLATAAAWVRKRLLARPRRQARGDSGFTIEHLEAMHASGQISREEFGRLRRQALKLDAAGGTDGQGHSSPPLGDDDGESGKSSNQSSNKDF